MVSTCSALLALWVEISPISSRGEDGSWMRLSRRMRTRTEVIEVGRRLPHQSDPRTIQKRLKEGRGAGRCEDYKPWLTIFDVPSKGYRHLVPSVTVGRPHHMLSDGEWAAFVLADLSPHVIDMREQYPLLPQVDTLILAEDLGVDHPAHKGNPIIMTTDLVLTIRTEKGDRDLAIDVKNRAGLGKPNAMKHLAISRQYWRANGVAWRLVVKESMPLDLLQNLRALRRHIGPRGEPRGVDPKVESDALQHFLSWNGPIRHAATTLAQELGSEPGFGLSLFYNLVAAGKIPVDLRIRIDPDQPLSAFCAGANRD